MPLRSGNGEEGNWTKTSSGEGIETATVRPTGKQSPQFSNSQMSPNLHLRHPAPRKPRRRASAAPHGEMCMHLPYRQLGQRSTSRAGARPDFSSFPPSQRHRRSDGPSSSSGTRCTQTGPRPCPRVSSPVRSCHDESGRWLYSTVDRRPLRFSTSSIRPHRCFAVSVSGPKSSSTSRCAFDRLPKGQGQLLPRRPPQVPKAAAPSRNASRSGRSAPSSGSHSPRADSPPTQHSFQCANSQ